MRRLTKLNKASFHTVISTKILLGFFGVLLSFWFLPITDGSFEYLSIFGLKPCKIVRITILIIVK